MERRRQRRAPDSGADRLVVRRPGGNRAPRDRVGRVAAVRRLGPVGRGEGRGEDSMKRPFALSVVVPVYNGAASVGELVGALRALDLAGGLEVVLVNDGSADDSFEVC